MNGEQLDSIVHGGFALVGLAGLALALSGERHRKLGFVVALVAGLVSFPGYDRLRGKHFLHGPELFHYVLGAKYFPELSYTGLYDTTVYAVFETRLPRPHNARNLATGELELSALAMRRGETLSSTFPGTRYLEFRNDVRAFHEAVPGAHSAAIQDHGFNATPPWIAVARAVQRDAPISSEHLVRLASIDVALLALLVPFLIHAFGLGRAAMAVLFFGTAYTFRFAWNGGSFLRYDWLFALTMGLVAMRKERWVLSGGFLAYATAMRLFPAVFVFAGGVSLLLRVKDPVYRRAFAAFAAGFLVMGLACAHAGTQTGRGVGAYAEFGERIRHHHAAWASNHIGLDTVAVVDAIATADSVDTSDALEPFEAYRRPIEAARRVRRPFLLVVVAAVIVAIAFAARRIPPHRALPLGAVLAFSLSTISGYYWAMLLVVPLVAPLRVSVGLVLTSLVHMVIEGAFGRLTAAHVVVSFLYLGLFADWLHSECVAPETPNPLDAAVPDGPRTA